MTAAFQRDIGSWALPEAIAPLLAPGLPAAVAARLQRSPRLAARCSAWLAETLGEVNLAMLSEDERHLVVAGADALRQAATLAGAVWHARRIAGLVLARDVGAFLAACGEKARVVALRHLSAEALPDTTSPLAEVVERDGKACLTAWIETLPQSVAARLWLMLPQADKVVLETEHRQRGPGIVRAIAAEASR